MRISVFVDKLRETITENGKEKVVEKDVLTVSGCKFIAMSQDVFLDGKKIELEVGDWLELEAVAIRLEHRIPHENTNYLYETIYIYTLPHLVAEEVTKQIAERFVEEKEEAIRVKVTKE